MNLGICINNVGYNQLYYELTQSINSLLRNKSLDHSVVIFYENKSPITGLAMCAHMHISEAFNFSGRLISTSMSTCNKLVNTPSVYDKYYYVYNFEWINNVIQYEPYAAVINCFKHIVRTREHKTLWENNWNKKVVGILPTLDINKLAEILNEV